jgi:hypothetical protein
MSFDDSSDRQISELGNSLNKGLMRNYRGYCVFDSAAIFGRSYFQSEAATLFSYRDR